MTKITWLWRGGEGPHDMPQGAYMHLVTTLQVDPDYASQLKCVEETSFEGDKPVRLIRLFDPGAVTGPVKVERFASLDQYPDLILFEGHTEIEGGKVYLHDRRSLTSPSRCEGVKD